jgi:exonuclease III
VPTIVGGGFSVIPEDIDCHKPASWMHDALFQPEPRALHRAMISLDTQMCFVRFIPTRRASSRSGIISAARSSKTAVYASTTSFCHQRRQIV